MAPFDWSDERTALTAAVATVIVVSIGGELYGLPFAIRSFLAVAAGIVAMGVASYALTGELTVPDE